MTKAWDESKVNRDRKTGQFADKPTVGVPQAPQRRFATHPPAHRFEQDIADALDREYDDPQEALAAAVYVGDYTDGGGASIHRHADGTYTLADDVNGHDVQCSLEYNVDGDLIDEPDFGGGTPDEYRLIEDMRPQRWDDMQPVKDFMDGKTDSVSIYTVNPDVYVETADGGDSYDNFEPDTDSTLYFMCADGPDQRPYAGGTYENRDFSGKDMRGSGMQYATMQNCNLNGADLTGANLSHCTVQSTKLDRADFTRSNLTGATFDECDLCYSTGLGGADLDGVTMSKCDLRDSDANPGMGSFNRANGTARFDNCTFGKFGGMEAVYTRTVDEHGHAEASATLYDGQMELDWKNGHRHHLHVNDATGPATPFTNRDDIRRQLETRWQQDDTPHTAFMVEDVSGHLSGFTDWNTGCWANTDIPASLDTINPDDWNGQLEEFYADAYGKD